MFFICSFASDILEMIVPLEVEFDAVCLLVRAPTLVDLDLSNMVPVAC